MSYLTGTKKNNDIYVRCWECGDSSKRSYIAHCAVDLTRGLYHCHKCQSSGKIPESIYIELCNEYGYAVDVERTSQDFDSLDGHYDYDARYTLLRSRLDKSHRIWEMRDTRGNVVGLHKRSTTDKSFVNEGERGYGYVGDSLVSLSSIRVVEGVYDVVLDKDVCVFGKLSTKNIAGLLGYRLILCPDNDVVASKTSLSMFVKSIETAIKYGCLIEVIEVLPSGEDPSSFYPQRGKFYATQDFLRVAKEKINK